MKLRIVLFLASATVFFSQCNNEKAPATASATPSVQSDQMGFYKHFVGTIDTAGASLDLVQKRIFNNDFESYSFHGHYFLHKNQEPIGVYGEVDSSGNIVLHETNWREKELFFTGKIDANGNFTGVYRNLTDKKDVPFSLKETYTNGALKFDSAFFGDSTKLWPDKKDSPTAYFDLQVLLPAAGTEGPIAAFLKDKIFMGTSNDTLDKSYANVTTATMSNALRDAFFADYKQTLKDEKPEDVGIMMNYAQSSSMDIVFNEKGLLSVGYSTYAYSGGAHGNHATSLATYDVKAQKKLSLSDVFLPKYEKTLDKALEKAARRTFDLKADQPLTERFFEDRISHNTNFCITPKGIIFLYNPYEIAAYAYGEIEIFVPFEEIKSVVNPRFLNM